MPSDNIQHVSIGSPEDNQDVSLLEILDHVLNAGVVLQGSIVISLAGVDLVYVGLNVVLTSVETALKHLSPEMQRVLPSATPARKKSSRIPPSRNGHR